MANTQAFRYRPVPDHDPVSPVVSPRDSSPRKISDLFFPIAQELELVEQLLRTELRNDNAHVDELAKYAFRLGGKRLRPALVLLAGKASGKLSHDHTILAAVVEMIHTATLVHDDILDEAALRRHMDSVNSRWGNKTGVLLGDYLFTHAFYLASTLRSTFACRTIGRATNIVCDGELRQIHTQGRFDLSEADYYSIINAKTAELCACCCLLGAHYSGADEQTEAALERFGRNLGIAFQIVDDLLDLCGDENEVGKSLGTDLHQLKPTLPLIHLLDKLDADERARIVSSLERDQANRHSILANALEKTDALEYARNKALFHANRAREELTIVADSPSKSLLLDLTHFVTSRRD